MTEALREYNARRLTQFMDAMPAANVDAPELTLKQINKLVHELPVQAHHHSAR